MTTLECLLVETFRAARWAESDGRPVCPSCYDSRTVTARNRRAGTGLSAYRCSDCIVDWSDISGTVLMRTKRSLREWAIALLIPEREQAWRYIGESTGTQGTKLRELYQRWQQGSRLGPAWKRQLAAAGITLERLVYDRPAAKPKRSVRA